MGLDVAEMGGVSEEMYSKHQQAQALVHAGRREETSLARRTEKTRGHRREQTEAGVHEEAAGSV